MKSNSCQRPSSSRWPVLVEHQLVERAVVAEVSRHAVEAGAQQPPRVLLLLLRVEVDAGPLRHEEGVGEGRAEAAKAASYRSTAAGSAGTARARAAAVPGVKPGRPELQRAAGVTHPVRHELAVLPEHERLRAVLNPGSGQVLDLRRELLAELDDEVAHPLTAGPDGVRLRALGRGRQLPPHRLQRGDRADLLRRSPSRWTRSSPGTWG